MYMRFDKILAANGIGSRKKIKKLLRTEEFRCNGVRITDPSLPVNPHTDTILRNGMIITLRTYCYLMLNKPAGFVTSTDDPIHPTVMELLPKPFCCMKLFPVGRLDIDTEGLLIITNDGALAHRITAPKSHCIKTYYIETVNPFSDTEFTTWQKDCATGITLKNGFTCMPAKIEKADALCICTKTALYIHVCEGKYHQIKKMIHVLGNSVAYLRRISVGNIQLDPSLPCGQCRELTAQETEALLTG